MQLLLRFGPRVRFAKIPSRIQTLHAKNVERLITFNVGSSMVVVAYMAAAELHYLKEFQVTKRTQKWRVFL